MSLLNEMISRSFLLILLIQYFAAINGFGQSIDKDSIKVKKIIKLGTSLAFHAPELLDFSFIIDYEKGSKYYKRFSSNYSIRYDEGPFIIAYKNPGQPTKSLSYERKDIWIKYNVKYYPILLNGESLNLLYINAGPYYFNRNINGHLNGHGPGFTYGIGLQIIFWKKISFCTETGMDWFTNLNRAPDSKKPFFGTTGQFYNIKIGFVLGKQ